MPRMRPIGEQRLRTQRERAISLGGSAEVGGQWSDDRLRDNVPTLRLVSLADRSGWTLAAVTADGIEVGRLAQLPSRWMWAIRSGARALLRRAPRH